MTASWLPQKPGMAAGTPWMLPRVTSAPGLRAIVGPGNSPCEWPKTMASSPGTRAMAAVTYSLIGAGAPLP